MTNPWHTPPTEPTAPTAPAPSAPAPRGNRMIPVLIAVVALLAVAAAGTIAWLLMSGPAQNSTPSSEPVVVMRETTEVTEPTAEATTATTTSTVTTAAAPAEEGASISSYAGMQATTPACNGEVVLIIESVLDDPARLRDVLTANPGSTFYMPGACPSLRARIDGQDIYPVVREYGSDVAGVCAAAAAGGGNARILNQDTSFPSPC